LSLGSIEGEHQLTPETLAEWMLADERLELAHELRVASGLEVGL
jgi:hypothetical protein